ncbi:MAG: hypothetical protein U1F25_12460 [Rubrivivax sp.]
MEERKPVPVGPAAAAAAATPGNGTATAAATPGVAGPVVAARAPTPAPSAHGRDNTAPNGLYTVKPGDTLVRIGLEIVELARHRALEQHREPERA